MLLKTSKKPDLSLNESQSTSESAYLSRRSLLKTLGLASSAALLAPSAPALSLFGTPTPTVEQKPLKYTPADHFLTTEQKTAEFSVTHYNNFYEFGLGKDQPAIRAEQFRTTPWSIEIAGEAEKTGRFDLQDILHGLPLEERIYRMRCVVAWSMVIPWVGFELGTLLKKFKPTSRAKYVEFTTLYDPKQMPGQNTGFFGLSALDWPYVEGLRMDEAMNPLTIIALGLYGKTLPNQNGAPLRLVVPWKYGFKGIKSIVKITFRETQPPNSWNRALPKEYGFFANVNPAVDHPRWSQKKERRIVDRSIFSVRRIETLPFNGYAQHVASMYRGMDLQQYF